VAQLCEKLEEEYRRILEDRAFLRAHLGSVIVIENGNMRDPVLPVNLKRLLWNARKAFKIDTNKPTDLSPIKVSRLRRPIFHLFSRSLVAAIITNLLYFAHDRQPNRSKLTVLLICVR
jgi:hypothetical protein